MWWDCCLLCIVLFSRGLFFFTIVCSALLAAQTDGFSVSNCDAETLLLLFLCPKLVHGNFKYLCFYLSLHWEMCFFLNENKVVQLLKAGSTENIKSSNDGSLRLAFFISKWVCFLKSFSPELNRAVCSCIPGSHFLRLIATILNFKMHPCTIVVRMLTWMCIEIRSFHREAEEKCLFVISMMLCASQKGTTVRHKYFGTLDLAHDFTDKRDNAAFRVEI